MASGHLTHPSWDSDSKRGTTDGTMRNKYDQARAQDMPIIERVHGLAERLGVPMARIALAWHWAKDVTRHRSSAARRRSAWMMSSKHLE